MTGTIDVLRMKPASDMLRLSDALQRLQAGAELVGLEAVNHLVLADARPDGGELLELRVEGDQAEQVLKEHRRHADRADGAGDRRGDRHAVDAAPRRERRVGDRDDRRGAGCSKSRTIIGLKLVSVDCAQSMFDSAVARLPVAQADEVEAGCRVNRLRCSPIVNSRMRRMMRSSISVSSDRFTNGSTSCSRASRVEPRTERDTQIFGLRAYRRACLMEPPLAR